MLQLAAYVVLVAAALGAPLVTLSPGQIRRPVFVVTSPFSAVAHTVDLVARADGSILGGTAIPWIAVAVSDQTDFPARLHQAGAWLVLDATAISGCLPSAEIDKGQAR